MQAAAGQRPRLVAPKSQASIRSVPLPDRVAVGIDQHLASCPVLVTGGLHGLLIRNSRGGPVWPRTFHARIWRQATEAAAQRACGSMICGTSMPAR